MVAADLREGVSVVLGQVQFELEVKKTSGLREYTDERYALTWVRYLMVLLQVRAVRDGDEGRVELADAGADELLLHVLAHRAGALVQQREQRPVVEQSEKEAGTGEGVTCRLSTERWRWFSPGQRKALLLAAAEHFAPVAHHGKQQPTTPTH